MIVKADRSLTAGVDICDQNFLDPTHNIGQYSYDLATNIQTRFSFKVRTFMTTPVFLNNEMYVVAYGYQTTLGTSTTQSALIKVAITITSNTAMTVTLSSMFNNLYGNVDQIAAFELTGFHYTLANSTDYGIYLAYVNTATYASLSSTSKITNVSPIKYKLFQYTGDNHMHRPVYATPSNSNGALFRVTTVLQSLLTSTTVDFYNFQSWFSRFHAMIINPGLCSDTKASPNYDYHKGYLINLRRMEVEKCIDLSLSGCGDGAYNSANGEGCDDGNLNSGDGCSSTCQVESMYTCTQVAGALSVCTPILCGNSVLNPNEECDDGNFVNNDGCTSCLLDIGWGCTGTVCAKKCGDGLIYSQKRKNAVTGVLEVIYQE